MSSKSAAFVMVDCIRREGVQRWFAKHADTRFVMNVVRSGLISTMDVFLENGSRFLGIFWFKNVVGMTT